MKNRYPSKKDKIPLHKRLSFLIIRDVIIVLFILELLAAIVPDLPHFLKVVAVVVAVLAGGTLVSVSIWASMMVGLNPRGSPSTPLGQLDGLICFTLFLVSLFGAFWEPVPQPVLWANVLILFRWLLDVVLQERRSRKKVRTDADCPDKIEPPTRGAS
ncbi:MAG: hypothetical protein M0P64_00260 [Candidatus Pacebacteria bacterium]|jgi:hypothetical protein|nr:hypothetical protein [Candidatus Paceibacterota bacterium]